MRPKLRSRSGIAILGVAVVVVLALIVAAARWLTSLAFMQDFLTTYPGQYQLPQTAPAGLPPWIGWQHFFSAFLIILIIRSGLQVRREKRPTVFWASRSPRRAGRKITLNVWLHQSLDALWLINGIVFVVLLFVTGQWMRIVPTSWSVFPNALSAFVQYISLQWPTEDGWVNYNALQQLAYFTTVFVAAPVAVVTGVRMSSVWPARPKALSRVYRVEWARAAHFPVMIYFLFFIATHVFLVFATGALRNLNHMYASRDEVSWVGFIMFVVSLVIIAVAWALARPLILTPIARVFGKVSR